jgi:mono/diheme cytochrome c family protein
LRIKEFTAPASVNVTDGTQSREIKVKAEVDNADDEANVAADIKLYANGQLEQSVRRTKRAEDDGEVDFEVKFRFTFTSAHVPEIQWWAVISVGDQNSPAATRTTRVIGPAPPTTTQPPPTTTSQPPTTTSRPLTATTQPPGGANGAAVYAASCAGCHGARGEGGFGGPVAGTSMNLNQVMGITKDGAGAMPGFSSQLTAEEIQAVAGFVVALGDGEPPVATTTTALPPGTSPGSPAALYRQHCAACHGTNADGGAGGPLVGSQLSFAQQVAVTSHGRASMPAFKAVLTAGEIDSIVRYIAGLGGPGSPTTTALPLEGESGGAIYGRLCAVCHGSDGSGGTGGALTSSAFSGTALAGVIIDGFGTMPGFGGQLDDGQLARLVAYVEGLAGFDSASATTDPSTTDGDPGEGFLGHVSQDGPSVEPDAPAAAGGGEGRTVSPLPIDSPLGWSLALSVAAAMIAIGSVVTGAMPKEAEQTD